MLLLTGTARITLRSRPAYGYIGVILTATHGLVIEMSMHLT